MSYVNLNIVTYHYIVYMENSNPVRLGTDDTLFDKVIVRNVMTLNVLSHGNDNYAYKKCFFTKNILISFKIWKYI